MAEFTDGRPINTAPVDGTEIEVFNPVTGAYKTTCVGGEFPLRDWGFMKGIWYPRPTMWRLLDPDG